MRFVTMHEALELHRRLIADSEGVSGVRDLGALDSALAQPQMTFSGKDLYPTLEAKAAALCFSLVNNHPLVDGNKRLGHAAMETFLVLNGWELSGDIDDAERTILQLASGQLSREDFAAWVRGHIQRLST